MGDEYFDYKVDQPLIKFPVEPGRGIIGCEMHEINGWGNTLHIPRGRFQTKVHPKHHLDASNRDREEKRVL